LTDADRQAAEQLHEEAVSLDDDELALSKYHEALRLDSGRPSTLYNVGLIHKYRGEWTQSLSFNARALALAPTDEAANWNLAIAATALRNWRVARRAWTKAGIDVGGVDDDTPIERDFGSTPVRLNPDGDAEVVWGHRIDPARVRLTNIPYPASGFRCGDVVLHDGAPIGERTWQGRAYPVFNVLELLDASALSTYEAEVEIGVDADLDALLDALEKAQVEHENWTATVRMLCKQCSEGTPHEHHDLLLGKEWQACHVVAIAANDPVAAQAVLAAWKGGRRKLRRFECKLTPPARH
jgi:tetratricopeptide (TPR) repeat protein